MTLDDYLDTVAAQDMVWGLSDCMFMIAGWLFAVTSTDVAEPYRGRYSTEAGAARVMRRAGGAVALLGSLCAVAGWCARPAPKAKRGDVGIVMVVAANGKHEPTAAICVVPASGGKPPRWAMRAPERGLYMANSPAVVVWGPL